ncbi:TPA: DUF961 family protein [Listeria monocytogenes]|uniref:DUF961 family protein n=1 Tax=Listeria monocytogenes TaxID=1639 RepID=UPI000D1DFDA7|nr:DUF961 family protein [Listeria monocytogenes]AVV06800.1 hypothetical protein CXL08_07415 [Listeria monocytogenes]EAF3881134.1 DUF961 domain-containing protein [Listeria monocytogenes]EAF6833207.1 DUF961 domain-containing protein [Listeria monocytogenes]ECC1351404.1 DUF961 domain-containing protein [Listeria monocytogenes]ECC1363036.1 DUF961 domain-containing protein [Listeria monocytogenes]
MAIRVNKFNKLTEERVDFKRSFGKLIFTGYDGEVMETNEDGTYNGAVKNYRYGVKSEALGDVFPVFLPEMTDKDSMNIPFGEEVELQGVELQFFANGNNVRHKVSAERIVPVRLKESSTSPSNPAKNKEKAS